MADPTPEDVYRAAAEAMMRFKVGDEDMSELSPDELRRYVDRFWDSPELRAAVDAAYAAGREAAAQAITQKASELRTWPSGAVSLNYINGWEDAAEIARGGQ